MNFSSEQQAAITAKNRELLVSAAAGSGKTAVLIEKIYTMLRDEGLSAERMLVVTFTRAAAAEMRERLKRRMADDADPRLRRERERLELIAHLHAAQLLPHARAGVFSGRGRRSAVGGRRRHDGVQPLSGSDGRSDGAAVYARPGGRRGRRHR